MPRPRSPMPEDPTVDAALAALQSGDARAMHTLNLVRLQREWDRLSGRPDFSAGDAARLTSEISREAEFSAGKGRPPEPGPLEVVQFRVTGLADCPRCGGPACPRCADGRGPAPGRSLDEPAFDPEGVARLSAERDGKPMPPLPDLDKALADGYTLKPGLPDSDQ
jgi:hypothetical protein